MKSRKKGEVLIYIVVAYGVTFLMGLLMWYGNRSNIDLDVFPNVHFLNNNLIPIISNDYTSGVLENQSVAWSELLAALVMNGLVFGGFLFAKPFRKAAQE